MKQKYILLSIILLIATIPVSGCIQQPTTTSFKTEQEQAAQPKTIPEKMPEKQPICAPNWECSAWSECNQSGKQTRICADKNNCGITADKPTKSQLCTPQTVESKSLSPQATESEPLDSQTVESEPLDSQTVESEPLDSQTVESEPLDSQTVEPEPLDSQTVEPEPLDSQTVEPESLSPQATESEPSSSQTVEPEPLDSFEIEIVGGDECVSKTNQALYLLKNRAKIHYDTIIKYIGIIECAESQSGMHVRENPPRYQVGKATVDAGTIWYAGTIVHDACHSKQYHDYLLENPSTKVPSKVYTGRNAEAQCLDIQYDALTKIGASQKILDYVANAINSEYWNVDYSERWW